MGRNAARRRNAKRTGVSVRRTPTGKVVRFPKDGVVHQALRDQFVAFEEKFGRPPVGDDPVFFDPDCDEPTPISAAKAEAVMVEGMWENGVHPALIYAFQMTGMMVTQDNWHTFTDADLAEYEAAVEQYERASRASPGGMIDDS